MCAQLYVDLLDQAFRRSKPQNAVSQASTSYAHPTAFIEVQIWLQTLLPLRMSDLTEFMFCLHAWSRWAVTRCSNMR